LGEIICPLIRRELSRIFLFREQKVREIFEGTALLINPER